MEAWWSGDVAELLTSEPETIVQRLALRLVETHYLNRDTQLHAWRQQIAPREDTVMTSSQQILSNLPFGRATAAQFSSWVKSFLEGWASWLRTCADYWAAASL